MQAMVRERMISLMELMPPDNQHEILAELLRQIQPTQGSQNNRFPTDIHQLTNEDVAYAHFLEGNMQTENNQTSNWRNERPVLMNRQARTTDSVQCFVREKRVVKDKFNSPPVTSEKPKPPPVPRVPHRPMTPPVQSASEKRHTKDEEPRFRKVKQETAAVNIKPEHISLDKTAGRAKVPQYKEHGSDRNSTKKKNSKKNEYAREKSNLVDVSTRTTGKSTKSSTNSPLSNLVKVLGTIFCCSSSLA
ncbi:hypothetical protein BT93_I0635 [Corymbia citriodora subsp. variegata]|nr:hypothetical protein BT93_I0635 [Corymbia citriodora subsp. variegata]